MTIFFFLQAIAYVLFYMQIMILTVDFFTFTTSSHEQNHFSNLHILCCKGVVCYLYSVFDVISLDE